MSRRLVCLGRFFRAVIFIVIFVFLFIQCSYAFRFSPEYSRRNLIGFPLEPQPVDVVCVGGSSTYVFWSPLQGFAEQGITSYDYAGDAMSPALLKNLISETRKHQQARLYLVDLRALYIMEKQPLYYTESYMRNYTDNLPYSWNRMQMVTYTLEKNEIQPEDRLSCYLDLIMYHGNWRSLAQSVPPERSLYKGFRICTTPVTPTTFTDYSDNQERSTISERVQQVLTDLLDYCKNEQLHVLFYLNTYTNYDLETRKFYNTVSDQIKGYGYSFLDTNDYFMEMGLDVTTDFYNNDHVDVLGAEKYTRFLGEYLREHYDLPDRRNDPAYAQWWEDYASFKQQFEHAQDAYRKAIATGTREVKL